MKKTLSLLLAVCMLLSVAAALAEDTGDVPLVVATSTLSQKFSRYLCIDTDHAHAHLFIRLDCNTNPRNVQ